jgi:hypothetical protein
MTNYHEGQRVLTRHGEGTVTTQDTILSGLIDRWGVKLDIVPEEVRGYPGGILFYWAHELRSPLVGPDLT